MKTLEEIKEVMRIADGGDRDIIWYVDGSDFIRCLIVLNDVFDYACADVEEITSEDIPLLRKCREDAPNGHFGFLVLFAARKRGKRPKTYYPREDLKTILDKEFPVKL